MIELGHLQRVFLYSLEAFLKLLCLRFYRATVCNVTALTLIAKNSILSLNYWLTYYIPEFKPWAISLFSLAKIRVLILPIMILNIIYLVHRQTNKLRPVHDPISIPLEAHLPSSQFKIVLVSSMPSIQARVDISKMFSICWAFIKNSSLSL